MMVAAGASKTANNHRKTVPPLARSLFCCQLWLLLACLRTSLAAAASAAHAALAALFLAPAVTPACLSVSDGIDHVTGEISVLF